MPNIPARPSNIKYLALTFYAKKLQENVTKSIRENKLHYTIIADETTDAFSNLEILTLCLRFVDLSSSSDPHIKECLLSFIDLERANAEAISR